MSGPEVERIDRALLREVANLVADPLQRDEMAGPSYLHPNPLVRWVFWKRLDAVAGLLNIDTARYDAGLDFGCGLGALLATLSKVTRQMYATDLAPEPAQRLLATLQVGNVTFLDAHDLRGQLGPESLDYVVSTDVLEHVDNLPAEIETLGSRLKPGGLLVVSGPTENVMYKIGRMLAGFGGKGDYHHTDIHRIHDTILRGGGFRVAARRVLPIPRLVEAFHVCSYVKTA